MATAFLALVGARPNVRIAASTSATAAQAIDAASGASAKRPGVTSLTLTSVVCRGWGGGEGGRQVRHVKVMVECLGSMRSESV
eukprot:39005-Chlamydomonas_euryale.AAC.1